MNQKISPVFEYFVLEMLNDIFILCFENLQNLTLEVQNDFKMLILPEQILLPQNK